jgi:hypothetical protein
MAGQAVRAVDRIGRAAGRGLPALPKVFGKVLYTGIMDN